MNTRWHAIGTIDPPPQPLLRLRAQARAEMSLCALVPCKQEKGLKAVIQWAREISLWCAHYMTTAQVQRLEQGWAGAHSLLYVFKKKTSPNAPHI